MRKKMILGWMLVIVGYFVWIFGMVAATPGAGEIGLMFVTYIGLIVMYSGIILMAYNKHIKVDDRN